jgi:hypothetical protein
MFEVLLRGRIRAGDAVPADTMLRPARDVFMAERDGVAVLLDLRREVYLGLDEIGTVAWREIENGASAESVTRRVCEEYDAPADSVRADMLVFVTELRRRRLVVCA